MMTNLTLKEGKLGKMLRRCSKFTGIPIHPTLLMGVIQQGTREILGKKHKVGHRPTIDRQQEIEKILSSFPDE